MVESDVIGNHHRAESAVMGNYTAESAVMGNHMVASAVMGNYHQEALLSVDTQIAESDCMGNQISAMMDDHRLESDAIGNRTRESAAMGTHMAERDNWQPLETQM
jgi:hypothetical protein